MKFGTILNMKIELFKSAADFETSNCFPSENFSMEEKWKAATNKKIVSDLNKCNNSL